ncbi:phospholipid scramblase 3-like [Drosophila bipectinata]|uniref:phospholipid scramblase 3-like n=1 Tax=Drosophila bipectinata TaxID=42026 RepID=UPI001C8AE90F|nr:phospholipid scramblase 3-like [Drosophila bipectinata]
MEAFANLETVLVKQKQSGSIFNSNRKYEVFLPNGQQVLYASQDNDFVDRNFLPAHHMTINVTTTPEKKVVMHVARPEDVFCESKVKVDVFGPTGNFLARIKLKSKVFTASYKVVDDKRNLLFKIEENGAFQPEYIVTNPRGQEVGRISKKFAGLFQEMFTSADNFKVTFSPTANVETKAIIFGATLLIDAVSHE